MTPGSWKYALAFANNQPNYYVVSTGQWGAPAIAGCAREDDARAIAALPDLLAACEQAEIDISFYRTEGRIDAASLEMSRRKLREVQDQLAAAIAKARP